MIEPALRTCKLSPSVSESQTTTGSTATPAEAPESGFRLAVLNPGGRDPNVVYADGPGTPGDGGHPPINFHAYAAATGGDFLDSIKAALAGNHDAVLVLIRRRVKISLDAVRQLKAAGRTVLVSWKEAGPYQIAEQLRSSSTLDSYQEILSLADGVLSPCAVLPPRWGWISAVEFARKTRFIPTPYPLESRAWDFGKPIDQRKGILVGTREFFTPIRNHLLTLAESAALTADLNVPVTVINSDKKAGRRMLQQLEESFPEGSLHIIDGPLPYREYLDLMASHKLVFQLDRGAVPGQVAGDALLCRTLCAGGNSAIEQLVFPEFADTVGSSLDALRTKVRHLLSDNNAYRAAVESANRQAMATVSYSVVAEQLRHFVDEAGSTGTP